MAQLPAGKTNMTKLRAMKDSSIEFDDEVPELTPARRKKMGRPVVRMRGQRGPQKTPTKIQISLRIDRDVLEAYKATGAGYLSLMNDALRKTLQTGLVSKAKASPSIAAKGTARRS